MKYAEQDFVLIGWQADDLPVFAKIETIVVIGKEAFFIVNRYPAFGISHHYHSYCVKKTDELIAVWLEEQASTVFRCHLRDRQYLITFRYHIECFS